MIFLNANAVLPEYPSIGMMFHRFLLLLLTLALETLCSELWGTRRALICLGGFFELFVAKYELPLPHTEFRCATNVNICSGRRVCS